MGHFGYKARPSAGSIKGIFAGDLETNDRLKVLQPVGQPCMCDGCDCLT